MTTATYTAGLTIPVQAVPSQTLGVTLSNQAVTLNIYSRGGNLFMDVISNGTLILAGVICQNGNQIIRDAYLGFVGEFVWWDTRGTSDPVYTGLGARWVLVYYP